VDNNRVFKMAFASVYPHYVAKVEKKGRTKEELHAVIHWLTGYDEQALQQQWKQVGVNVTIQTVDPNTLTKQIENPPYNYQISTGYMTSDIIDPDELVSFAQAGNGGTEITPITYTDNYVSLWPGESTTITATYGTSDLGGQAPYLRVRGYNVPTTSIPIS